MELPEKYDRLIQDAVQFFNDNPDRFPIYRGFRSGYGCCLFVAATNNAPDARGEAATKYGLSYEEVDECMKAYDGFISHQPFCERRDAVTAGIKAREILNPTSVMEL